MLLGRSARSTTPPQGNMLSPQRELAPGALAQAPVQALRARPQRGLAQRQARQARQARQWALTPPPWAGRARARGPAGQAPLAQVQQLADQGHWVPAVPPRTPPAESTRKCGDMSRPIVVLSASALNTQSAHTFAAFDFLLTSPPIVSSAVTGQL